MGIASLIFAVFALFFCVYLWLELQKKPSRHDIGGLLSQSSEDMIKSYEKKLREIETEWTDMYQKFSRLAGRVDKTRALETAQNAAPEAPRPQSRSDLLRLHKNRGGTS